MPLFSYNATTADGERTRGMVDAISLQAARSALQETGLFVEEIHEALPSEQESVKPWETEAVVNDGGNAGTEGHQVGQVDQVGDAGRVQENGRDVGNEDGGNQQDLAPNTYNLTPPSYYPLLDTLRLYAGWLLAWYVLVIALGAYQETKELPFTIPLVEGLWQSVLIIRAAFGVFLFLLCTSLHRFCGNRTWLSLIFGGFGIFLFYVFLVNT